MLCLLIGVRSFTLLRCRHKNPPPPAHCDSHMFRSMMMFALCFAMGTAHGWGILKMRGQTQLRPSHPMPLFQECPHPGPTCDSTHSSRSGGFFFMQWNMSQVSKGLASNAILPLSVETSTGKKTSSSQIFKKLQN